MTEQKKIIDSLSRDEMRLFLMCGGVIPKECCEAEMLANKVRRDFAGLFVGMDGKFPVPPNPEPEPQPKRKRKEADMRCKEFTVRRDVSGPVLSTIKITIDDKLRSIRGNNATAESLEADILAAVSCIAGDNACVVHQREYEDKAVA